LEDRSRQSTGKLVLVEVEIFEAGHIREPFGDGAREAVDFKEPARSGMESFQSFLSEVDEVPYGTADRQKRLVLDYD
jgi:hypothetical protein